MKPLLQERTKKKIQVLQGNGKDELLKVRDLILSSIWPYGHICLAYTQISPSMQVMDFASLPHFCKKQGSGSSRSNGNRTTENCFSFDHAYHQQLYNFIKHQAVLSESVSPIKQGSFHVDFPLPNPEDAKIARTIEVEFHRLGEQNGLIKPLNGLKVDG